MCLTVKRSKLVKMLPSKLVIDLAILRPLIIRKAEGDIQVYKVLKRRHLEPTQLLTPHTDFPVPENMILEAPKFGLDTNWSGDIVVEEGIHSYTKASYQPSFLSIFNATIPKGTPYIEGYGNELVSLKLVIGKEVTPSMTT